MSKNKFFGASCSHFFCGCIFRGIHVSTRVKKFSNLGTHLKPKCSRGHFQCPQGDISFSQPCTKGDRGTILIGFNFCFYESGSDWASMSAPDIVIGSHNTMSDIGPIQYQYSADFNDVLCFAFASPCSAHARGIRIRRACPVTLLRKVC